MDSWIWDTWTNSLKILSQDSNGKKVDRCFQRENWAATCLIIITWQLIVTIYWKERCKCLVKSNFTIAIIFFRTICQICLLLQRAAFDFNQEYLQKYEGKQTAPKHFLKSKLWQLYLRWFYFVWPQQIRIKRGNLRKSWVSQNQIARPDPCL